MKKNEITIGGIYRAKVSDKLTDVRIDQETPAGGWSATNLATGKTVRIKSAHRLRAPSDAKSASPKNTTSANTGKRNPKAAKDAKPTDKRGTGERRGPKTKGTAKPTAKVGSAKKVSGLDLAAQVLAEAKEPMTCKEIVDRIVEGGQWATNGKTPHATIYSAILREIQKKGADARFVKVDRGRFSAKKGA